MPRIVHLDEHVSRVQASTLELLADPSCLVLILSPLQVSVLRQMTFPYVWWPTRLIEDHETWQETVEFPDAYVDELECLELLLSGGNMTTCDLSTVLASLAEAIRTQPRGGGNCAPAGPAAVLGCLPNMLPEQLVPQDEVPAPEYGEPPEGFATWAEYLVHKCQAAYAIVDVVAGLFGALAIAPITITTLEALSALFTGYIGALALADVVFTPAVIIELVAGAAALGILEAAAFMYCADVQRYVLEHKDNLACSLYLSGSGAEALDAIGTLVEDAIQSVAWAELFGPVLGGQIAAALGVMGAETQTNNLVNPLFHAVAGFVYRDVTCTCEGECEEGGLADFSIDLNGATLYEDGAAPILGSLEWDGITSPPGPSAKSVQDTGHSVGSHVGWQEAVSYVVAAGAQIEWRQLSDVAIVSYIDIQVDGEWVNIYGEQQTGDQTLQADLVGYEGQWMTGLRWYGGRNDTTAWVCRIPWADVVCP
jgi:hypothetical protein